MAVQLTLPAKANVLTRQDAQVFFKAFKKGDGKSALNDLSMKIAMKTNPDLNFNDTKKALERIEIKSGEWKYTGVETNSDTTNGPLNTKLILPNKIGLSVATKMAGTLGLVADGLMAFATFVGTALTASDHSGFKYEASKFLQSLDLDRKLSATVGEIYAYLIPIGIAIAGGYGVFRIAKNIVSEWKAASARDLQQIACAIEAAVGTVLPKKTG